MRAKEAGEPNNERPAIQQPPVSPGQSRCAGFSTQIFHLAAGEDRMRPLGTAERAELETKALSSFHLIQSAYCWTELSAGNTEKCSPPLFGCTIKKN